MRCPKCGGRLRVRKVESYAICVKRYRKCASCGAKVTTVEEAV